MLRRAAIDRGRGPTADGCETRRGGDRAEWAALASAWPAREKSFANAPDGSIGRFLLGIGLVVRRSGRRLKCRLHVHLDTTLEVHFASAEACPPANVCGRRVVSCSVLADRT